MNNSTTGLERYLVSTAKKNIKSILNVSLFDPVQNSYMIKFAAGAEKAFARRKKHEAAGLHVPTFLIASITGMCNLHCAGCYARSLESCSDGEQSGALTAEKWDRLFSEASELGIVFTVLAGGEPLVRRDVIEAAAGHENMLFAVFTNGTMAGGEYAELFAAHRNIVPVFSIEGEKELTDGRRGSGVYEKVMSAMDTLKEKKLMFGASVTVTSENIGYVTSDGFVSELMKKGCRAVIYVEYVPTAQSQGMTAVNEEQREQLARRVSELRAAHNDMFVISFPGDEKESGGCLAAGRGFIHINSRGGAEPCPFSPYSDINAADTSLAEALDSPLMRALRSGDMLTGEHDGGCVLFSKRSEVERLLLTLSS